MVTQTKDRLKLGAKLRNALRGLGNSPYEVASKLEQLGIKGKLGDIYSCPISNFVKSKLDCDSVQTDLNSVDILRNGHYIAFCTPNPIIREFIKKFDDKEFKELIEKEEVEDGERD